MLKQFAVSPNEIYQEDFLQVVVLNRFMNERSNDQLLSQSTLFTAFYQQKASKTEMLKQFAVSPNEIYQEDFLQVVVLNRFMNERSNDQLLSQSTLFTAFYQQKASKTEMLKQFGVSPNVIYQEDSLQVALLNRSTKAAKISSFRRAPCSQPSISGKRA